MGRYDPRIDDVFESNCRLSMDQFVPMNCLEYKYDNSRISFRCEAGQDEFNIPGLHTSSSLAYTTVTLDGDFTFCAECRIAGTEQFDGAGIYLHTQDSTVKFGLERYKENDYRIVTVRSAPLSDEANGSAISSPFWNLVLTRCKNVFSCYSQHNKQLRFERAFAIKRVPIQVAVGLFLQSPFSKSGAKAVFDNVRLARTSLGHIRE